MNINTIAYVSGGDTADRCFSNNTVSGGGVMPVEKLFFKMPKLKSLGGIFKRGKVKAPTPPPTTPRSSLKGTTPLDNYVMRGKANVSKPDSLSLNMNILDKPTGGVKAPLKPATPPPTPPAGGSVRDIKVPAGYTSARSPYSYPTGNVRSSYGGTMTSNVKAPLKPATPPPTPPAGGSVRDIKVPAGYTSARSPYSYPTGNVRSSYGGTMTSNVKAPLKPATPPPTPPAGGGNPPAPTNPTPPAGGGNPPAPTNPTPPAGGGNPPAPTNPTPSAGGGNSSGSGKGNGSGKGDNKGKSKEEGSWRNNDYTKYALGAAGAAGVGALGYGASRLMSSDR